MYILITIIHIVVCLFLIAVVLLQSGKSADIAAAFGGMGSQTAFGPAFRGKCPDKVDHLRGRDLHAQFLLAGDHRHPAWWAARLPC